MIALRRLVHTLDAWLDLPAWPDFPGAFNGLQIEGPAEIATVASAVDACAATSAAAVAAGADLLIVHHGMFWGATAPLVGPLFDAVAPLMRRPCALYAAHLPLDGHPEFGNNALLADRLGIPRGERRPFGDHGGARSACSPSCRKRSTPPRPPADWACRSTSPERNATQPERSRSSAAPPAR